MINGQTVLGLITARGGSKGVPGKHIRIVGGKPLIAWTIQAGKASRYLDRLVLSSDEDAIIDVAKTYNCDIPFKRSKRLATDDTPSSEVVLDALDQCPGFDWVVLLQPTSPLRIAEDIDACIERCISSGANSCVSVVEANDNPYWTFKLDDKGRLCYFFNPEDIPSRRQDLPLVYVLNGAVYVARCEFLKEKRTFFTKETLGYAMPRERSLDIDEESDVAELERMLQSSVG